MYIQTRAYSNELVGFKATGEEQSKHLKQSVKYFRVYTLFSEQTLTNLNQPNFGRIKTSEFVVSRYRSNRRRIFGDLHCWTTFTNIQYFKCRCINTCAYSNATLCQNGNTISKKLYKKIIYTFIYIDWKKSPQYRLQMVLPPLGSMLVTKVKSS